MEILLALTIGVLCIVCFITGAKVGQTVSRGETIETPNINPVKAIREHQARKEAEKEQNRLETIMSNIDNYDGTSYGQKDVPR
jgi:hypothetical protein